MHWPGDSPAKLHGDSVAPGIEELITMKPYLIVAVMEIDTADSDGYIALLVMFYNGCRVDF